MSVTVPRIELPQVAFVSHHVTHVSLITIRVEQWSEYELSRDALTVLVSTLIPLALCLPPHLTWFDLNSTPLDAMVDNF